MIRDDAGCIWIFTLLLCLIAYIAGDINWFVPTLERRCGVACDEAPDVMWDEVSRTCVCNDGRVFRIVSRAIPLAPAIDPPAARRP